MAKHIYAVALAAAAFSVYSPALSAESGAAPGRPDAPAQTPGDRPVIFNPGDVWLRPCPGRLPLGDGEPLDLCFEQRLREMHHPRPLAETLKMFHENGAAYLVTPTAQDNLAKTPVAVRPPSHPAPGDNAPSAAQDSPQPGKPWLDLTQAQKEGLAGAVAHGSWQLKKLGDSLPAFAAQDVSAYLHQESSGLIPETTAQKIGRIAYGAAKETIAKAPVKRGLIIVSIGAGLYAAYEFFRGEDKKETKAAPAPDPYKLQRLGYFRSDEKGLPPADPASSTAKPEAQK